MVDDAPAAAPTKFLGIHSCAMGILSHVTRGTVAARLVAKKRICRAGKMLVVTGREARVAIKGGMREAAAGS
jgi:hypothetical protein